MAKWPWIERRFNFDYPAMKWPDLLDLESLMLTRIEEILAGARVLTPADMTNRETHEANHNSTLKTLFIFEVLFEMNFYTGIRKY